MTKAEFSRAVQKCLDSGVPDYIIANEFRVTQSTVDRWRRNEKSVPNHESVRKSIVERLKTLKPAQPSS